MKDPKLTPWFDGSVKPTRVGVYQRNYDLDNPDDFVYCKWDGNKWYCHSICKDDAWRENFISLFQNEKWRGLAEEPR